VRKRLAGALEMFDQSLARYAAAMQSLGSAMTNKQFIALLGTVIVLLIGAMLLERYRDCQEKGGDVCWTGPSVPVPSYGPR
jgi:hypothetical protein